MGCKSRKKPAAAVADSMMRLFELMAVNDIVSEGDRKFYEMMKGKP